VNFKRVFQIGVLTAVASVMAVSPALAAKPDGSNDTRDVIAISNGFPSGEHFNLNIHGKKVDYIGDPSPGGNSVFILEYGESTIQYVTNRKASLTELYVLDPLAEAFDGDAAMVQLPYERDGYYVFGRILGKPNNGSIEPVSSIILRPNTVVGAYNDVLGDPDFGSYTGEGDELTGPLLDLGLIVGQNMYIAEDETYVRFDTETTKGKSKATDITDLFTYTGWVIDSRIDSNGDGVIDINDVPMGDYDNDTTTPENRDYNNDGYVDEADVEDWLYDQSLLGLDSNSDGVIDINDVPVGDYDNDATTPENKDYNNDSVEDQADADAWLSDNLRSWYYDAEWMLNIADLVITEQGLVNDGTKLLQIRFYPVDTTEFVQQ